MRKAPKLESPAPGRRALWGAGLGLGVALLLALLRPTPVLESLELPVVDLRTRMFASERAPDERIVLMQIGESDVEDVRRDLGQPWPWPLEFNARMVDVLREAGASVLVVDILHLDNGAGPDDVPDAENLPLEMRQLREGEAYLAEMYRDALKAFGQAVVGFELADEAPFDVPARREATLARLDADGVPPETPALVKAAANLPVRRVAEGAARLGFVNAPPDADGVVRRATVRARFGEHDALSLMLAAAKTASGRLAWEDGAVLTGGPAQRLTTDGRFVVNHHEGHYARVRASQVVAWTLAKESEGALPPAAREALAGRIVILGINLAGQKDVVASPLGTMDGPAWQATVLDNLLHGDGRVPAPRWLDLLVLFGACVLVGWRGATAKGRFTPHVTTVLVAIAVVLLAILGFGRGTVLDVVTPLLGLLLVWGGAFALRALTEGRRNRWLEGVFGRYMSPSLVEALKRDPSLIALGGREREISIFFSDVAGFTTLSERLDATDVVRLLNRYLTDHCAAVMREDGVIDKFEGDAVMAFFGDPVEQPDHALRACRAALAVQAALPDLAPLLAELGIDTFHVRIGINSGRAVVGNMGSDQRFDYTCIGDSVNLASRLEGAGKAFGVRILIGEATARAVEETMLLKPLGGLVVVGKAEPVGVYELLAERARASEDLTAHVAAFAQALEAARDGDVAAARAALARAGDLRPDDGPVAWLRGVLDGLDGPWDGVTVLGHK